MRALMRAPCSRRLMSGRPIVILKTGPVGSPACPMIAASAAWSRAGGVGAGAAGGAARLTAWSMSAITGAMRVARSAAVPVPCTCMKYMRGDSQKK